MGAYVNDSSSLSHYQGTVVSWFAHAWTLKLETHQILRMKRRNLFDPSMISQPTCDRNINILMSMDPVSIRKICVENRTRIVLFVCHDHDERLN